MAPPNATLIFYPDGRIWACRHVIRSRIGRMSICPNTEGGGGGGYSRPRVYIAEQLDRNAEARNRYINPIGRALPQTRVPFTTGIISMGVKLLSCVFLVVAQLLLLPVSAHGHVKKHVMNGVEYTGYLPVAKPDFTADAPSIG